MIQIKYLKYQYFNFSKYDSIKFNKNFNKVIYQIYQGFNILVFLIIFILIFFMLLNIYSLKYIFV